MGGRGLEGGLYYKSHVKQALLPLSADYSKVSLQFALYCLLRENRYCNIVTGDSHVRLTLG